MIIITFMRHVHNWHHYYYLTVEQRKQCEMFIQFLDKAYTSENYNGITPLSDPEQACPNFVEPCKGLSKDLKFLK